MSCPATQAKQIRSLCPFVNITLFPASDFSTKCQALVDSGAEVSVIAQGMLEPFHSTLSLSPNYSELWTASGDSFHVMGSTSLPFHLGTEFLNHTFVVVECLSSPCILGADFLTHHNLSIDYQAHKFCWPNGTQKHTSPQVRVRSNTFVPPKSER